MRIRYSTDWDLWFQLFLEGPVKFLPEVRANYRIYNSLERGTSQLAGGARSLRFNRNQFKRNFARMRAWKLYREMRRAGLVPRPRLGALVTAHRDWQ